MYFIFFAAECQVEIKKIKSGLPEKPASVALPLTNQYIFCSFPSVYSNVPGVVEK
jgi:hypothetical protein